MLETIIESNGSLSSFVSEFRAAFKNKAQYGLAGAFEQKVTVMGCQIACAVHES